MKETIQIEPDEVSKIAARLYRRLDRDGLLPADGETRQRIIESLADELHEDIIDRMLSPGTTP